MSAFGANAFAADAFASNAFGGGGGNQERQRGRELGGRPSRNPLIQFLTNEEIEALQERPDLLHSLQMRDDEDITDFIITTITRGLL